MSNARMKKKQPSCEYLAPKVKVMELKSRNMLCLSDNIEDMLFNSPLDDSSF